MLGNSISLGSLRRWFSPDLPLPEVYRRQVFTLAPSWHIGIALMLNILSLAVPIMMLQVYDRIIPHQAYGTLAILVIGVLVALFFDAVLRLARAWLAGRAAASHEHAAACAAMERFANARLDSFEQSSAGAHIQNFSALDRLREFYSGQSLTSLVDLPFAGLFLLMVAYLGHWLVIVPLALLAVFVLFSHYTGQFITDAIEERTTSDDRKASYMISVLSGIHTVKSLGLEALLSRRFEHSQNDVTRGSYKVALASGEAATLSAAVSQLSLILTAAVGTLMVINGHLSVGGLSACTMLAGRALQPVQRVLGTWLRLQDLTISSHQAATLFKLPVQVRSTEPLPPPHGRLQLRNVNFCYDPEGGDRHNFALKNVSLSIEPGEVVAIAGDKSSGKSTLLQIMAGLLPPTEGTVRLDGFDPALYGMDRMRAHVGYLPQQGIILKGSILDNITGFMEDDESISAAKQTGRELGLDNVVDLLARGYSTQLSNNAADPVPPGVKQRIVLARVLRHHPALLLFDDADRALDKEGYNRLFRLIGRLKGQSTIVMISHDQNLLSFADRGYLLEHGTISEVALGGAQPLSALMQPLGSEGKP